VSEVSAVVELAWREGVGPDDLAGFRALLPRLAAEPALADDPATGQLRLFAAWLELLSGVRIEVPAVSGPTAVLVLHAAATVMAARLARDAAQLDSGIDALGHALDQLTPSDPRGPAARAWADFALAEVGVLVDDAGTTRRRFEAVAASGSPVALRIQAMLRLAAVAMKRFEVEPARNLARKAAALADASKRPLHAERARLAWAMFDAMSGDVAAMRKTLAPAIARGDTISRILLAGAEKASRAMELLGDGLREATERGDPFAYMLCILVGARRYVEIGHHPDALITITAGIAQLTPIAPDLAAILSEERSLWQSAWGPELYSDAEARAVASLDKGLGSGS
jgi:hypothetical protein